MPSGPEIEEEEADEVIAPNPTDVACAVAAELRGKHPVEVLARIAANLNCGIAWRIHRGELVGKALELKDKLLGEE